MRKESFIFCFCLFYVGDRETERKKTKWKRPKNYKTSVFLRWSSKNEKNQKGFFWQKLPDTICVSKGEKPFLLFIFLGLPVFLFSLFLASPFSLYLSLSLSCPLLSSLLPVSHVNFWFLLFVVGLFACCFKMFFCFRFSACCRVRF